MIVSKEVEVPHYDNYGAIPSVKAKYDVVVPPLVFASKYCGTCPS